MQRSVNNPDHTKRCSSHCSNCMQFPQTEWHELSDSDLHMLCASKVEISYRAGQALYSQGDPSSGIYCLKSGTVAFRQLDESGNSVLLGLAYAGDIVGYRSLVAGEDHNVSAEALGPSTVCKIARNRVLDLIQRRPALGLAFLRRSSREVQRMHSSLVRMANLSNRGRLLQVLAELMEHHGQRDETGAHRIELPISRRDLASMIGTRHETLSRVMGRIENEDLAKFSGRKVLIPNVAAFVDAAENT